MTHPLCLYIVNHKALLLISNEVWLKFSLIPLCLNKQRNYGLLKNVYFSFIHFISTLFVVFSVLGQVSHFQVTLTSLNGLTPFIDNLFFTFLHALRNGLNKGNRVRRVLVGFWDGNNCINLCKVESNF